MFVVGLIGCVFPTVYAVAAGGYVEERGVVVRDNQHDCDAAKELDPRYTCQRKYFNTFLVTQTDLLS
jgi:hypothetical protein